MGEEGQEPQPKGAPDGQVPPEPRAEGQEPDPNEAPEGQEPEEPKTFDEAYVKQLRREATDARTRARKAETELERLTGREKTDTERLTEEKQGLSQRAEAAESTLLRYRVASERKLDLSAADFLKGTTREEIESSADELVKLLASQAKHTPSFDGGVRETPGETKSPEQQHNEVLLRAVGKAPAS